MFQILTAVIAVLMIVLGVFLPRFSYDDKPEIRLPGALSDREKREAVNRFAGTVWVVCGVLSLLGAMSGSCSTVPVFFAIAVILSAVYAFRLSRKKDRD